MHLALSCILSLSPVSSPPAVRIEAGRPLAAFAAFAELRGEFNHAVATAIAITSWWWTGDPFWVEALRHGRESIVQMRKARTLLREQRALLAEAERLVREAEERRRKAEEEFRKDKP